LLKRLKVTYIGIEQNPSLRNTVCIAPLGSIKDTIEKIVEVEKDRIKFVSIVRVCKHDKILALHDPDHSTICTIGYVRIHVEGFVPFDYIIRITRV